MRILHITAHLGGGVGKAHAAMQRVMPREMERFFVLLEEPRDPKYVHMIEQAGGRIIRPSSFVDIASLAAKADVVQFEFWNHPRLFECLARCPFPAIRSVFWSHISGLTPPLIPPGLVEEADRFILTTEASRKSSQLSCISGAALRKLAVINSGFGLFDAPPASCAENSGPDIAYLGTVDFVKMHPCFFEVVDKLQIDGITVAVWGTVDPDGPVATAAKRMRHPERIMFRGHAANPFLALTSAAVFFYPLQPDHYGTAENALIEAMSIGLVPVVLDNPAETAIVQNGITGMVAHSVDDCVTQITLLLSSPELRRTLSRNAVRYVAESRTPKKSADEFVNIWKRLLRNPARIHDFKRGIGDSPADWFLATQDTSKEQSTTAKWLNSANPSKGTLAHFKNVFVDDRSLAALMG